jgi:sulfate/thiosulfate transport system substrate-binding protein
MKLNTFRNAAVALVLGTALGASPAVAQDSLLNVSYDISRELFEALNPAFAAHWQEKTGRTVTIDMSHGGSSRQARAILEGLNADVVTFNQETDIDVLAQGGLLPTEWRDAFPNNASPYYSLPAFLVRAGNPKNIRDWDDLARPDVAPVFPNPKTSGNARYTYLAAYAFELERSSGDEEAAQELTRAIFSSVPVFDTGGRAATQTFAERNIGDVLVTFEAETGGIAAAYADQGFERVTPSVSLFAAFPVAVVAEVAERNGNTELATAYLEWLYSPEAQRILAENYYRVTDEDVVAEFGESLSDVRLVTVDDVFGGWDAIRSEHLADGAILDQVFVNQ